MKKQQNAQQTETLTQTEEQTETEASETVHFIEDLEVRRNASGPVTTLAIGEEEQSGW